MFRYLFKHRRESDENMLRKFEGRNKRKTHLLEIALFR
jgi:hypothetical protein